MANHSSDKLKKVFDVSQPGKTAADASSRPIIVGHKTTLRDPMVKDSEAGGLGEHKLATAPLIGEPEDDKPSGEPSAASGQASAVLTSPSATKINVKPLNEISAVAPANESQSSTKEPAQNEKPDELAVSPDENIDKPAPVGPQDSGQSEENKPDVEETEAENPNGATVDAVAAQAKDKKSKQQAEAEAAKTAAIEKLIAEKKYHVPIGVKTRKKSIRHLLIVLFLIIILGVTVLYVMVDADIVDIGIRVPFEIIKQER